ncbi:MAG: hypothetical protein SNJ72_07480 [Fimbriimonadales bacterium]
MAEKQAKSGHRAQATSETKPMRRPNGNRTRTRGALLPSLLLGAIVGAHVLGIALLNLESARRERLTHEITQLRIQNEQLQARLNLSVDEIDLRRWAEAAGMVRVDTAENSVAVNLPLPEESRATVTARLTRN